MTISFLLYIIHFGVFTLCKTEHPDDIIGGIYMRRAVLHKVKTLQRTGAAHKLAERGYHPRQHPL